jgi:PAS domain S-box-containing protein
MNGTHELPLVALSVLIAICASYTALTLAGRVALTSGRSRLAWLIGGSIAMGSGIWSMHFVAMLAFHLPIDIAYDVPLVFLSWVAAVAASAFALFVASQSSVSRVALGGAGVCLGLAVVTMHYTGMAAVRVQAHLTYDPLLVAASVLIAIVASTVALLLFRWLRHDTTKRGRFLRMGAAVVMGVAIAGMHYTAMAAAHFHDVGAVAFAPSNYLLPSGGLAVPVIMGAFVIIILTMAGAVTDHWVRLKLATAEALRESEERYRTVVGEIDEVIFRTDEQGHWTFLNPAWTEITGLTPEASLGQPKIDSVHPDDRELSRKGCEALAAGTTDYVRHEIRYSHKDGSARWVEVHARAIRANGKLMGTAGVIRDVTERRRAEEALRSAREAAEQASRAKSEFLSRMSHELRTPLNAILGFGQLAELEAATPPQKENADHILKAGRHLLSLINEVLDITSIESGRMHLSVEPVHVGDAVKEVFDLMEPLAKAKDVRLIVDADATSKQFVLADRQRLKQVLLNLVANAVKYNRLHGTARVSCEYGPFGTVKIVVADSGPGIPADRMHRLFTAFDRLGAEQGIVEGTGLGLALSKRLAEAMSGELGVACAPGEGCHFWIALPGCESPGAHITENELTLTPAQGTATARGRRHRILYVEDNLSNLALVQRILARRNDIELIPAMQGGLALALAQSHRPDLVLLDLHLPDMPGEEVLRQLRNTRELAKTPVVVLSADATPGQVERLLALGAHAYVTKPLEVKEFIATLDNVLDVKVAA